MREVCPMDVATMLKLGAQATLWEEWTAQEAFKDLAPAPYIEPVAT